MTTYPDDADGDALRRVAGDGSDMTRPMDVDFFVAVHDESAGYRVARVAEAHGYAASVKQDSDDLEWTCYCTKSMVLTYDAVVAAQTELDSLAVDHNGHADGWGTFGNAEDV